MMVYVWGLACGMASVFRAGGLQNDARPLKDPLDFLMVMMMVMLLLLVTNT